MNILRPCLAAALALLLSGCLEVNQHPGWRQGEYDGKRDDLHYQRNFHGDKLAWSAAVTDRTLLQNEYRRANP